MNKRKLVVIGGQVESEEDLIARKPDVFRQKQNIDVRIRHEVIDMAPQLMASLDKDMTDLILEYMTEQQVKVFLEEKLVKFENNNEGSVKSVITDKQTIPADIVVLGLGVKPNSELAARAGLQLGAGDAIQVNNITLQK